jgi:ABC-type uncharacterized transport system permease subunit
MIGEELIGKDFEGGGGELINTVCYERLALKLFLHDFDVFFNAGFRLVYLFCQIQYMFKLCDRDERNQIH